jgi:hypothetical protein
MSRRPLLPPVGRLAKAQSRMAPGGMLWSESPIPRRHSPRVPQAGEEPAAACGTEYPRTAMTATTATFDVGGVESTFGSLATRFSLVYTSSAECMVRVASIDLVAGSPAAAVPTPWQTLPAAPSGGVMRIVHFPFGGDSQYHGWVIEWDAPVVSDLCSDPATDT